MTIKKKKIQPCSNPVILAGMISLSGIVLLFMRNPDPIIHPTLYAEDGTWVALALTNGWINALVNARPDYFVVLNILLLFIATKISFFLKWQSSIIPSTKYRYSFILFFSGVGTFCFFTMRKVMPYWFAFIGFLLIILLPLGGTQNEIIGRILQIGFYMPLLATLLLFGRDQLRNKWKNILLMLVFSFVVRLIQ